MSAEKESADRSPSTPEPGLFAFLKVTKRWWLLPLVVVFVLVGALLLLSLNSGGHSVRTAL